MSSKHSKLNSFAGISSHFSPKYEDEDKNTKEKEPCELESRKSEKDPPSNHLVKVSVFQDSGPNSAVQTCDRISSWVTFQRLSCAAVHTVRRCRGVGHFAKAMNVTIALSPRLRFSTYQS